MYVCKVCGGNELSVTVSVEAYVNEPEVISDLEEAVAFVIEDEMKAYCDKCEADVDVKKEGDDED